MPINKNFTVCVDLLKSGGDKSPELVGTSYRNRWGQDSGIGGDECPELVGTSVRNTQKDKASRINKKEAHF